MKKILLTIFTSLGITNIFGLTEKQGARSIAESFEKNYNENHFDAIFNMFDGAMQKALPLNKTIDFLSGLRTDAGKILKREFINYDHSFASYKTTFEKGQFIVNISVDEALKINGLLVESFEEPSLRTISRNITNMMLPFKDEWTVIWGGDTKTLNYHVEHKAQKNAFDLVITDADGKSYKTTGQTNQDYYAFGKELLAPCSGEVVLVVDGVKDNKPGYLNPIYVPGNTVIIKTANDEYLFFAHFKQHSIKVKQGEKILAGQMLGLCGNSGNSSEPHIHFHIQNAEDMQIATGVKCFFDKLTVNGEVKTDYSPIQNDKVKPAN